MTPLKALILQLLSTQSPLNDLELWSKIRDQETGGLCATVVICCIELRDLGLIEAAPNDPNLWQLSDKGLTYVAQYFPAKKEVSLGSI